MKAKRRPSSPLRVDSCFTLMFVVLHACVLTPHAAAAEVLTGTRIGTVRDEQGAVVPNGQARVTAPALIGGPRIMLTNESGQFRFSNLAPGSYTLDIEVPGFASYHGQDISIGAAATLERTVVLKVAG